MVKPGQRVFRVTAAKACEEKQMKKAFGSAKGFFNM